MVPGLPIRDCAGGNNFSDICVPMRSKMSTIDVTAKTILERLYLVPGLGPFGPRECTGWGGLRNHPHEQDFTCELPLSRLISFSPTCSLLLPWQASPTGNMASPTGNIGSDAANPVISIPHRLCSSEIPKPLSARLVVMPPRHHQSALPSLIGELLQKQY